MASYVVPQVEIHQLFSEIPVALAQNQVAFVFGPNYQLHRCTNAVEMDELDIGAFEDGTGLTDKDFPALLSEERLDRKSTRIYARNAIIEDKAVDDSLTVTEKDGVYIKVSGFSVAPAVGTWIKFETNDSSASDGLESPVYTRVRSVESDGTTVILEDALPGATVTAATLCTFEEFVEIPETYAVDGGSTKNWSVTSTGTPKITVNATVKFGDKTLYRADGLHASYRELILKNADAIHEITLASNVAEDLGTVDPENPLAQAVYNAALNAGGQTVRFMAVESDDLDGFNKVLSTASLTKDVYFLCPVSRNEDVINAVKAHVESMSANPVPGHASAKRWRVAFVSKEIPTEHAAYTKEVSPDGEPYKAIAIANNKLQLVETAQHVGRFTRDLRSGDRVIFGTTEYKVDSVLTNNEITVKDATIAQGTAETEIKIYHAYTKAETAGVIRDTSSSLASRRIYNVWPSKFTTNGIEQTGEFAAACVAGLVSSCLPQQPVTNLELTGIGDVPDAYKNYSLDELNTIASGGTFIVMQDTPNDQVYVRHQISTDYEANNLNTAELSITKNLDSISYFFDDLMSPYIGKYNITPELIDVLENVITGGLVSLESTSYGLYGPQLIADGTELLLLEQDAVFKDHVNCNLKLNMPYPFNHLVLKLFV